MEDKDIFDINSGDFKPYLTCKDYTVSRETFDLLLEEKLELLITSPKPKTEDLGRYYESEDYISHSNSKKSFLDKVYQIVRNYTIKQKVKLVNSFDDTYKTILDIGAGTGDFLRACKNSEWQVTGIEPNKNAKTVAEQKLQGTDYKIYNSIEDLNLSIQKSERKVYDVITMWHVLEHVPNLREYISNLKLLLKPDATLIIAVPNYKSYDAIYYKEFWAAYDVPRHLWHFSKKSIQQLFQRENMKVKKILPMKFDSFYISLLSEKYNRGNQIF